MFGVEPDQADDAFRSLQGGAIVEPGPTHTIADGLRAMLCPRTFAVIRRHVRDILLVSEEQIVASMRLIWQRMKLVVEPSGAVGLAAVLAHRDRFQGHASASFSPAATSIWIACLGRTDEVVEPAIRRRLHVTVAVGYT